MRTISNILLDEILYSSKMLIMDKQTKVQNRSTKNDPVLMALPIACADENAAVAFMEMQRWGDHPTCPRCGSLNVYQMKNAKTGERQANFRWRCRDCASVKSKDQFSVRTGTVFEDSKCELRHWCFAFWRAATGKKGVSALEIHRQTGLAYKTCLFMLHRIRFAMNEEVADKLDGEVEIDEVYLGGKGRRRNMEPHAPKKDKIVVMGLKERGGRIRPKVLPNVTGATVKEVIRANVEQSAHIHTDEAPMYKWVRNEYASHNTVNHSRYEYARLEDSGRNVTTNSVEGFWSMLRRGLDGIYHSVSEKHLERYLAEFQFRHDHRFMNDGDRTVHAIRSANGKRLTYAQQVGNE